MLEIGKRATRRQAVAAVPAEAPAAGVPVASTSR
jgi:hypothetical protein